MLNFNFINRLKKHKISTELLSSLSGKLVEACKEASLKLSSDNTKVSPVTVFFNPAINPISPAVNFDTL